MHFREDVKAAADVLRKTVPEMISREIPIDPYNYALWYAYVTERNPELKDMLEKEFPGKGSYSSEKSEGLFFEYFVKEYLPDNEVAQKAVADVLSKLFSSAEKTSEGTKDFGDALQAGMTKLQSTDDVEEINSTLQSLMDDTEKADQLTKVFRSELGSAQEEIDSLRRQLEVSEKDAFTDQLTKIGNRRAFNQILGGAVAQNDQSTCLLMLDLDHFKAFNDNYGHLIGDSVLGAVGKVLQVYETELIHVTRYGGEEFGVVTEQLSLEQAVELAENIRGKVAAIRVRQKKTDEVIDSIAVSIGVAARKPNETEENLIKRADEALYGAKEGGRNQVNVASDA